MPASDKLSSNSEMSACGMPDGLACLSKPRWSSLAARKFQSPLVKTEQEWRRRPCEHESGPVDAESVTLTRWTFPKGERTAEVYCDTNDSAHVITLTISNIVGKIYFNGNQVPFDVPPPRGTIVINGPIFRPCKGVYDSAADLFRVYVSQMLIQECFEGAYGCRPHGDIALFDITTSGDKVIKDLTWSLLGADALAPSLGLAYVDGIGLALAARLLALHGSSRQAPAPARHRVLSPSRLRRVYEYVEENLQHGIRLADLSNVVDLSRVHFAAQFRAATGISPYKFILQRRIERAQLLLSNPQMAIVDIALAVGFADQAHFSAAYKKAIGSSPNKWRKTMLGQ